MGGLVLQGEETERDKLIRTGVITPFFGKDAKEEKERQASKTKGNDAKDKDKGKDREDVKKAKEAPLPSVPKMLPPPRSKEEVLESSYIAATAMPNAPAPMRYAKRGRLLEVLFF